MYVFMYVCMHECMYGWMDGWKIAKQFTKQLELHCIRHNNMPHVIYQTQPPSLASYFDHAVLTLIDEPNHPFVGFDGMFTCHSSICISYWSDELWCLDTEL